MLVVIIYLKFHLKIFRCGIHTSDPVTMVDLLKIYISRPIEIGFGLRCTRCTQKILVYFAFITLSLAQPGMQFALTFLVLRTVSVDKIL